MVQEQLPALLPSLPSPCRARHASRRSRSARDWGPEPRLISGRLARQTPGQAPEGDVRLVYLRLLSPAPPEIPGETAAVGVQSHREGGARWQRPPSLPALAAGRTDSVISTVHPARPPASGDEETPRGGAPSPAPLGWARRLRRGVSQKCLKKAKENSGGEARQEGSQGCQPCPPTITHPRSVAGAVTRVSSYTRFFLQDAFTFPAGVLAQLCSVTWPG